MRQLYYSIQNLQSGRGSNVIKLLSLTLGLFIGILLFSQIAYEFSYESFYNEPDRVAVLRMKNIRQGVPDKEYDLTTYFPAANDLKSSFPDLIECSTAAFNFYQPEIYREGNKLDEMITLFADTLFFKTMGIDVLDGKPQELAATNTAFISSGVAKKIFGSENPIGKVLLMNNRHEIIIRGVYRNIPGNTTFPHNLVISLATGQGFFGRGTWNNNDIYNIFFRLKQPRDIQTMNERIQQAVSQYKETEGRGLQTEFSVIPLSDVHFSFPDAVRRMIIMGILGFSIFFVSTMNYVLICVASFSRRSKSVAVHKCNGADGNDILSMFLWETGLIILAGVLLCLILLFQFRDGIEELLNIRLEELFVASNLWVPAFTVLLLFLISGFLPGRMFAHIPVTQIFRRYTESKRSWKRSLLFIEFIGVSFILGVLLVAVTQYQSLMNKDLGFDTESLAMAQVFSNDAKDLNSALCRQPYVADASRSSHYILSHYNTTPLLNTEREMICPLHYMICEKEYPKMMGMTLVEGSWPQRDGDILIGETVVKKLKWTDGAIGKKLPTDNKRIFGAEIEGTIVGVVKDVRNMNYFIEQTCVAFITSDKPFENYISNISLKEPFDENLQRLNAFVKESYPRAKIEFVSSHYILGKNYEDAYRFRNTVLVTSLCILLIVLMGLIGYVNDETQRRSKEIAIRKVNGAEVGDILRLFAKDILTIALMAVLIGTICAYYVSGIWMEQFVDCEPIGVIGFAVMVLFNLALIVSCVMLKAWHIANENPVKSIKSE